MSKDEAKTYTSEAMAAIHEMMEGLHQASSIDKRTMHEFDEAWAIAIKARSSILAVSRSARGRHFQRLWKTIAAAAITMLQMLEMPERLEEIDRSELAG